MQSIFAPVFVPGLVKCYQLLSCSQEQNTKNAISTDAVVPGQKGKMMAVTIRNIDQHSDMLSELKQITDESTVSKALIKGGYLASRYKGMYETEKSSREELERELHRLKRQVKSYFDSKAELEDVASKYKGW